MLTKKRLHAIAEQCLGARRAGETYTYADVLAVAQAAAAFVAQASPEALPVLWRIPGHNMGYSSALRDKWTAEGSPYADRMTEPLYLRQPRPLPDETTARAVAESVRARARVDDLIDLFRYSASLWPGTETAAFVDDVVHVFHMRDDADTRPLVPAVATVTGISRLGEPVIEWCQGMLEVDQKLYTLPLALSEKADKT